MTRWLRGTVIVSGVLGALLALAGQPQLANHFGYALPAGLPFRLSYAGRYYANPSTCAGAGWCKANGPPRCTSAQWLRGYHYWPLQQVGAVFTLFGPLRPLLRYQPPAGMTTMALYVPMGHDCYLAYGLEGGP